MKLVGILVCIFILSACANSGRYSQRHDSNPERIRADIDFRDVTPQYEPYLPASMRPYTVLGKHYRPLNTGKGYAKEGIASWYGQKFHGHLTANGEIYDMFAMSAAHKTLPLPSFVKVTNLANGKQAIVRVNDRGPFHANRIIDLSYAAAMKIDVLDTGTAPVKVEVMHVDEQGQLTVGAELPPSAPDTLLAANPPTNRNLSSAAESRANAPSASSASGPWFIQVAALQDLSKLEQLAKGLENLYQVSFNTPNDNGLYRLHLGPLKNESDANSLLQQLHQDGYSGAFRVAAPN